MIMNGLVQEVRRSTLIESFLVTPLINSHNQVCHQTPSAQNSIFIMTITMTVTMTMAMVTMTMTMVAMTGVWRV